MKNTFRALALLITIALLCSSVVIVGADEPSGKTLSKELRGVLIDSFENKDFPSKPALTSDKLKAEIKSIVAYMAENKLNAAFIKVCASGEALFDSAVLPTSYFLTGEHDAELNFDPLNYLISTAHNSGIEVYAWIDPIRVTAGKIDASYLAELNKYSDSTQGYTLPQVAAARGENLPQNRIAAKSPLAAHPEYVVSDKNGAKYFDIANPGVRTLLAGVAGELAKNYDLDGIQLSTDIYENSINDTASYSKFGGGKSIEDFRKDNITALLSESKKAVEKENSKLLFGAQTATTAYSGEDAYDIDAWIKGGCVDFLAPQVYHALGAKDNDFATVMDSWAAKVGSSTLLIPAINSDALGDKTVDNGNYADQNELLYEILYARNVGADGHIYSSIKALQNDPLKIFEKLYRLYLTTKVTSKQTGFEISQSFALARPAGNISTSGSSYFILGTSNPNKKLYVNGEEVTNRAPNGTYGVFVKTPVGTTTVTVKQGDKTFTRKITRSSSGGISLISKITQSSMQPVSSGVIKSGGEYKVSCTAPSGGKVSATINGVTVGLTQVAAAQDGVPAKYTGTLTLTGDFDEDVTTKVGPITYTLSYGGKKSSYTSSGDLYYVGANTTASAKVNEDITLVYSSTDTDGKTITNLRKNSVDYIESDEGNLFKLSMGGYIKKSAVTLVEGAALPQKKSGGMVYNKTSNGETYTIKGAAGAPFKVATGGGGADVMLYNVNGISSPDVSASSLFTSASVATSGNQTTLSFDISEGKKLGGCNVEYAGDDLVIFFKAAPKRSSNAEKPLEGISVVLDPGHGGVDPGAVGPTGDKGPVESDLTLATAFATRSYLEKLGAKVYMTRLSDTGVTQTDRAGFGERVKPDFFVSIHINASAETTNSNNSTGVEIYYYTDKSSSLASNLLNNISGGLNRKSRNTYQSTYVVTRSYYAPAVLCELGFISNPAEYEEMASSGVIDKTGYSIAQGILGSVSA